MDNWPKTLRDAVNAEIDKWWNSEEGHPCQDQCCDNWRYARASNEEEVFNYEASAEEGCCGFFDTTIEVEGETIMIGFNYGH